MLIVDKNRKMNNSVNKVIKKISDDFGYKESEVKLIVDAFIESIEETLKQGGHFSIHRFGSFSMRKRAERAGINLKTQEKILIPEKVTPFFVPSGILKKEIRKVLKPEDVEFKKR